MNEIKTKITITKNLFLDSITSYKIYNTIISYFYKYFIDYIFKLHISF